MKSAILGSGETADLAKTSGTSPPANVKKCSKCFEVKDLTQFHKKPSGVLGVDSHCKVCVGLRKKAKKARQAKAKRANCIRKQKRPSKVLDMAEFRIRECYIPTDDENIRELIKEFIERIICRRIEA